MLDLLLSRYGSPALLLESGMTFGLTLLTRGAKNKAREMGVGVGAGGYAGEMPMPQQLSKTPAEDVLNHALDIRRRIAANASAGE